ncbi:MAG: hypothetical protein NT155_02775 [Candidatus Staskawiczbacteria bacterium]|nr:hypothetical protein [Candidatus Staskawiczbacteria bacterium]
MDKFILFAQPWWVNIFAITPFLAYYLWHKKKLNIPKSILVYVAIFGVAFGFVEASVVVYLRTAIGLILGKGVLALGAYQQAQILSALPSNLWAIEFFREATTLVMLMAVALIASKITRERWAMFLWAGAFWDTFYYIFLFITIQWPSSLLSPDVLFLIPVPWFSQVWYPILISLLTISCVLASNKTKK